jgi:hypothetical protein
MPITTSSSDHLTVTSTSQKLRPMTPGVQYILSSEIACYYSHGTQTGAVASAADESHYLPANTARPVAAAGALDTIAIIRVGGADGPATLSRLDEVP